MSMYLRLLGIAAVMSGFGLSEALPAGDVWKGSWKFEIDRQDQPWLGYYDTRGKTVLRIGCGAHLPEELQNRSALRWRGLLDCACSKMLEQPKHSIYYNKRPSCAFLNT
jgi:hypothetical protein